MQVKEQLLKQELEVLKQELEVLKQVRGAREARIP